MIKRPRQLLAMILWIGYLGIVLNTDQRGWAKAIMLAIPALATWIMWPVYVEAYAEVRAEARRKKGRCPSCGYDLRETPERCPECGTTVKAT